VAAGAVGIVPFGISPLFWFFLKVGSILFGSGYVLLAFLRADLVERWHWLTESQLLDAIAGRPDHTRPGVHHRDFHWLHPRRSSRFACCHGGDFPSRHLSL
jgi:chromate transporter